MTTEEYQLLLELRMIPQQNSHYMFVHGAQIELAKKLVADGLVVSSTGFEKTEYTARLNKRGRDAMYAEAERRRSAGEPWLPKDFEECDA